MTLQPLLIAGLLIPGSLSRDATTRDEWNLKSMLPEEQEITGVYRCEGETPIARNYEGIVKIEKLGRAYRVTWLIGKSEPSIGIGIKKGSILSVSYVTKLPTGIGVSVVVYEIESGPRMIGQFTELGGRGDLRNETLTFIKRLGAE